MGKERPPRRTRAISTRSLTRWLANSRHSLPSMVSLPPKPFGRLRGRVPATSVPDMMSLKRLTSRAMRGIRRRPRLTTSRRKWAGPARRARPSGGWAPLRLGPGRWSYGVIRWGQPGVSVARAKRLPGPLAARAISGRTGRLCGARPGYESDARPGDARWMGRQLGRVAAPPRADRRSSDSLARRRNNRPAAHTPRFGL